MKGLRTLALNLGILAGFLFAFSQPLSAQCNKLITDVTDTLMVKGTWAGGAVQASGYIQFRLNNNETGSIAMVPSPLTHVEFEDEKIQAANVGFQSVSIQAGLPANAVVSILNAPMPGIYTGEVVFYLEGQLTCKRVIALRVVLGSPNQATVLDADVTYNIVKSPVLAGILPARLRSDGFSFRVENPGTDPVELSGYTLSMIGEQAGRSLQSDEVVFYQWDTEKEKLGEDTLDLRGMVLPAQSDVTFVCQIKHRSNLSPDTYKGRLKLLFKDAKEPATVSLTMHVRAGVLGVILVLVLGIVVGRQVTKLDSPEVKAQMALMPKLVTLRRDADKLSIAAVEDAAHKELDKLEADLNQARGTEEDVLGSFNERFTTMEAKLSALLSLDELDESIYERNMKGDKKPLFEKIGEIRTMIFDGKIQTIQPLIDEVKTAADAATLSGSGTRSATRGASPADDRVSKGVNKFERSLEVLKAEDIKRRTAEMEVSGWWKGFKKWWRKIIVMIMGVSISAGTRFWFIKPLITGLFFVGFLLFGFHSLYIENGIQFGQEGLYDYFQVFIWGATTDIVSRTVGGLGSMKIA